MRIVLLTWSLGVRNLIIACVIVYCCPQVATAQGDPPRGFELFAGYSRDISSSPNIPISFAFNERQGRGEFIRSFHGFDVSAAYTFLKGIGIKIEVAKYASTGHIQAGVVTGNAGGPTEMGRFTLQGGLQLGREFHRTFPRIGSIHFRPFGHVLAGINRQDLRIRNPDPVGNQSVIEVYGSDTITTNGLALTIGGGVDIPLNRLTIPLRNRLAVRVVQLNYTMNTVPARILAESPSVVGIYTTAITGRRQNQFTIAFGIVLR